MNKKLIEEINGELKLCERKIEENRRIIAVAQREIENYGDRKTMLEGLKKLAMEEVDKDGPEQAHKITAHLSD